MGPGPKGTPAQGALSRRLRDNAELWMRLLSPRPLHARPPQVLAVRCSARFIWPAFFCLALRQAYMIRATAMTP